jgi:hypothetical protein
MDSNDDSASLFLMPPLCDPADTAVHASSSEYLEVIGGWWNHAKMQIGTAITEGVHECVRKCA